MYKRYVDNKAEAENFHHVVSTARLQLHLNVENPTPLQYDKSFSLLDLTVTVTGYGNAKLEFYEKKTRKTNFCSLQKNFA